jgi:hypothetical protein
MASLDRAPTSGRTDAPPPREQRPVATGASYVDAVLFGRRRASAPGAVRASGPPAAAARRATDNNEKGTDSCAS